MCTSLPFSQSWTRPMNNTTYSKRNMAAGFFFLAAFMIYGFVLIYLRDFAPGKRNGSHPTEQASTSSLGLRMFMATLSLS